MTLATDADLPDVLGIDEECFPPGRLDRQPAGPGELEEGIRRSAITLARFGRVTAGYLHAESTADGVLEIRGLAVAGCHQRQGIGTALVNHCLATALDESGRLPEVLTLTSPLNRPMLELLFRHGFVGRRLMVDHFGPGRHRLACHLSDVIQRTGEPRVVPLAKLPSFLTEGNHLVVNLRKEAGQAETSYVLAPVLGVEPYQDVFTGDGGGPGTNEIQTIPTHLVTEGRVRADSKSMSTPDAALRDRFASAGSLVRNEEAPWDRFDPNAYYRNNYVSLRADDKAILEHVGKFFSEHFSHSQNKYPSHALDIGSGANLYPALSMLPWATHITLGDHSPPNRPWLEDAVDGPRGGEPWSWAPFWEILSPFSGYDSVTRPEQQLATLHRTGRLAVEDLDILGLPPLRRWDLGTMFFVAESISEDYIQFSDAIRNFLIALRPGAPFAAAFMVGSGGYPVKGVRFPAVKAVADDIGAQFATKVAQLQRHDIPKLNKPLRDHEDDNYEGMLLLVGVTKHS